MLYEIRVVSPDFQIFSFNDLRRNQITSLLLTKFIYALCRLETYVKIVFQIWWNSMNNWKFPNVFIGNVYFPLPNICCITESFLQLVFKWAGWAIKLTGIKVAKGWKRNSMRERWFPSLPSKTVYVFVFIN